MTDHLKAILAGEVTKTNVIGIRKALNADARRARGYSTSRTSPKMSGEALDEIVSTLAKHEPRVVGELHESGLKLLRSPRYRKRLELVADIVDGLESFHLVGYDTVDAHAHEYAMPVYRARGAGRSFLFRNVPWQSGGDGPEILAIAIN